MPDNSPRSRPRARRARSPKKPKITQSLGGLKATSVRWLWWPWIPLAKVTIIEGEPDVGKSTLTNEFAALVTRGETFPPTTISGTRDDRADASIAPADVILVGVEDDLADTVVPRLDAAGADRSKVHTLKIERDEDGMPIPFIIPDDVNRLRAAIEETGALLVVVDPITAFISEKVKSGSDTSNRKALMVLAEAAADSGAAVVLVRHLNKAAGMDAKSRGGGSIAYTALARSVLVAGKRPRDPDGDEPESCVLARTKGNLGPLPDSIGYSLVESPDNRDVAVVVWNGPVAMTADQLVGADRARPDSRTAAPDRLEAERVLREILADGPVNADKAKKATMRAAGVSESTVNRAKRDLGVASKAVHGPDGALIEWVWMLPE